jgi:hypothetical protein
MNHQRLRSGSSVSRPTTQERPRVHRFCHFYPVVKVRRTTQDGVGSRLYRATPCVSPRFGHWTRGGTRHMQPPSPVPHLQVAPHAAYQGDLCDSFGSYHPELGNFVAMALIVVHQWGDRLGHWKSRLAQCDVAQGVKALGGQSQHRWRSRMNITSATNSQRTK